MEVVILKTDGTPVRLDSKFTQLKFDSEGFLYGFTYANEIYKFFQNDDFEYKSKDVELGGYYAESVVHQYIANMYNVPMTPLEIKALKKFPFVGLEAKQGDSITVKVVDFSAPYNYYYRENKYTFNIEAVDNKVKKYKKPVFDNVKLIGFEIDLPSSSFPPTLNDVNLMEQPTGYFFRKNFGEFVGNWSVTEVGKRTYKKITTLSAYKINYIVEDVIKHIISESSLQRIYGNGNSGTSAEPDPNGLSPLENLVFTLLWNWGYFYKPTDDPQYIYRTVLNPIMSGQPDFYEYSRYLNGLSQFYFTAYRERDKLKELSDYKKIEYLLSILPLTALKIMPYPVIKSTLLTYLVKKKATEEEEQFIVRLVLSIAKANANNFLDFLLERPNGVETNFDVLYNLLDDGRPERYPIVNWFVDEETNRKYFVYAIYELWKVTKYNWDYFPPNVNHNAEDINEDSYFIVNADKYNENNVLEFYVPLTGTVTAGLVELRGATKYFTKIKDNLINITGKIDVTIISKTGIKGNDEFKTENLKLGNFHLYHPLKLIGYQPNLELEFPQTSLIPAFLYYYAEEYDELADFDAGVALAINVGIDIALFFATGGGGILNSLKCLKRMTEFGRALSGALPSVKPVTIWRFSEMVGETVTVTAGIISNYNGYLATKANDAATQEHHLAIQRWMIGIMLFTGAATVYARSRAVREADKILTMMSRFPGTTHGVPADIVELLGRLRGKQVVLAANLENTLNNINKNGIIDNVIARYNQLDARQKYLFFDDFSVLTEKGWKSLNQNANTKIDNWLLLKNGNIAEAKNLTVIADQRLVNGFVRYYAEPELRLALENLDNIVHRVRFVNSFADLSTDIFAIVKEIPVIPNVFSKIDSAGQVLITSNPQVWVKTFKARQFLSVKNYEEVAELYGKGFSPAHEVPSLPGIRWVIDGDPVDSALIAANNIANNSSDINIICLNYNVPTHVMTKVKSHFWVEEHFILVEDGTYQIGRFEKNDYDIDEWNMAIANTLTGNDLQVFQRTIAHEYVEAKLMEKGLSFRSLNSYLNDNLVDIGAHEIAPVPYLRKTFYEQLNRRLSIAGPPEPDLDSFSNLDYIVDWFTNFYKL